MIIHLCFIFQYDSDYEEEEEGEGGEEYNPQQDVSLLARGCLVVFEKNGRIQYPGRVLLCVTRDKQMKCSFLSYGSVPFMFKCMTKNDGKSMKAVGPYTCVGWKVIFHCL